MSIVKRCIAELLGTFWLVFGGCGSAVIAATFIQNLETTEGKSPFLLGITFVGVALAFGLSVLTIAYTITPVSGCHLNPAVSFGLWAGKRFRGKDLLPYIVSQVLGAILGSGVVYLIASGREGFSLSGSNPLATNGFGVHSPGGYSLAVCFIIEVVTTFMFLIIVLGATDDRTPQGFAPIAIGLGLTLIHLNSRITFAKQEKTH